MAIDNAAWHYGGNFPEELPKENGGTHIGFFLAWIINKNLQGDLHRETKNDQNACKKVRRREITGRDFLFSNCDERFWSEDLNQEGLDFTNFYYNAEEDDEFNYFHDLLKISQEYETNYHLEDTWENYDKLRPYIDKAYKHWKKQNKKSWWPFGK